MLLFIQVSWILNILLQYRFTYSYCDMQSDTEILRNCKLFTGIVHDSFQCIQMHPI